MFKNYLKIAFRNLIKNKSHTAINVGGLTLGVVCALVIFLVIQYNMSFDTWHEDSDRIYRVVREDNEFGDISTDTGAPYPFAEVVEEEVTGLEFVTRVNTNSANTPIISYQENGIIQTKFKEDDVAFVEKEYFDIFTYRWMAGDPDSFFDNPNTVVITEEFAKRIFGTIDVLGREFTIQTGSQYDLTVTGLVKDPPETSDFPFFALANENSKSRAGVQIGNDNWSGTSSSIQTYVKLLPNVTPEDINPQFDPLLVKHSSEERAEVMEFSLQPLSEIHFDSRYGNYSGRILEKRTLFAMGIIGFLLLITACINFINLNTAIAVNRSKEVGLRKTLGGSRTQLSFHFLGETAFITLISILIGMGVTEFALLNIDDIIGFTPELDLMNNPLLVVFLGILFLVITLAAGWYPAHHLSGFNPIEAIRNKMNSSYGQGLALRRTLIIVQFTITQILIIGTLVIATQIKHFNQQELGFEQEAVVQIDIPDRDKVTLETLKNRLKSEASILNVTYSNTGTTFGNVWGGNYVIEYDSTRIENSSDVKYIDVDFLDTYGIKLLAGSNIQPSDTVNMFLVSESLVKQAGFGDDYDAILGKELSFWGDEATIVGVVNDFHTSSLHQELRPVVLAARASSKWLGAIKINTAMIPEALATLEEAYNEAFPEAVFEYTFLEDSIADMYGQERDIASIMNIFAVIAVIIGCLGLFGLVSYMAATRTKEIGVRKVLGANIMDILKIFGYELGLLIGFSFLLAAPLSWYLMQRWLEDFAYKIELGVGIFLISLTGTLIIACLTIGYRSISAALANPVDSLKTE
ncbi:MAG: FtsX-like permease family protein [Balneola sp.]|nr:MAG: FtsX-like permease family protein [Balneola sp.]